MQGDDGGDPEAGAAQCRGAELAAVEADAFPHADNAVPRAGRLRLRIGAPGLGVLAQVDDCLTVPAAVGDLNEDLILPVAEGELAVRAARVPDHVGERLLNYPVRREVYACREVLTLA